MTIKSISQKVLDKNHVEFEGDVEILFDDKVQVRAHHVAFNKEKQRLIAQSHKGLFVKLENPDFLMLAERIELNLGTRTGVATNIKIHVREGFISASLAKKIDDQTWEIEDLRYTSCDHAVPHWAFSSSRAMLYKNSVLKATGLAFKVKNTPVFAFPGLVFPLQGRAGSGFLMPRLSYDAELGLGFRQEYYMWLGEHCDTTVGFNVVQKKGFVLSDEFRWARNPENFLVINGYYAEEWNALLERKGRIISATDMRYWVQGEYFQPFSLGHCDLYSLIRFDFGTDKRIGYHFLNDTERVEDSFYNTCIQRYRNDKQFVQLGIDSERSLRKQFSKRQCERQEEREEKVMVNYVPRYEWNTSFYELLPHLYYRHDFLFDYALLESRVARRVYVDGCIDELCKPMEPVQVDTTRLCYHGRLQTSIRAGGQILRGFVDPIFQLRSKVKNNGDQHKLCARYGVEWSSPIRDMQTSLRWSYLPKFNQDHWYHIDKYDRLYPENRIDFTVRKHWLFQSSDFDLFVSQGYDFYDKSDIFYLRRCHNQQHLLPLHLEFDWTSDRFGFHLTQEYSWKTRSLIEMEAIASFATKSCDFFLGYVYQKGALQRERRLLSDVSSFVLLGGTVPIGESMRFHYNGSFYSNRMKPLLQSVGFEYDGHCWGLSIGFEEKRYRQYGKWKSERAITLSLRLESIGSFAQKIRGSRYAL